MKALIGNLKGSGSVCGFFYGFAAKEKKAYPLVIAANMLLLAVLPFLNLLLPKRIIDELTGGKSVPDLCLYVGILVGGTFIIKALVCILQEIRAMQEDELARKIDLSMTKKAMDLKFEYTESEEALSARQKAETGMSWYSGGIRGMSDCVIRLGTSFFVIFGVIWIVIGVSPVLLLLSVTAVAVNALCTSKINRAAQEVFEKTPAINKFYSYIYTKINDRRYAKELRLYNAGALVEKKAADNAKDLNRMDNECAKKQFSWGMIGSTMSAVGYGISYGWLAVLALNRQISVSEFVMCITAMETLTNDCLIPVITNTQQLMMKCNFMSAFIAYMGMENETDAGSEKTDPENFEGITFEHVSFKYPGTDQWVLRDINLKIKKGESISIVGLNGAGKSTLVKLICRLYRVSEGEIKICGKNINEYSYEEYVKLMSVVFQDFKLFGYSIKENVMLGRLGSGTEDNAFLKTGEVCSIDRACEMSGISEWIDSLEKKDKTLIGKDYDETGVEPSGGEAQKLAIARAIYRNAPVVILDEPTAALDPVAEYEIYSRFHDLIKNRTAIYISHRLSSCRFCDRIVVLNDNTIQECGSHEELMAKKGIYAGLFTTQANWYVGG